MSAGVPSASVVRSAGLVLLSLILASGAYAGIIYWAWQGSLIGVAVSALLPGGCAVLVLPAGLRQQQPDRK